MPPLHVQRAPMRLLGVGGGPGAAAARPACAQEAAGRGACVSDARSLLFSLLFAARAAAQVLPLHVQLAPMRLLGVVLPSVTLALLFSMLFTARAAARRRSLSSILAAFRGDGGGPGAAAARPACAYDAAGRDTCVSDARSLLFSLLFAAMAAAQVPPLHVQLAPMRLLGVVLASVTLALVYSRCSSPRGRRPA
eukprot:scaffold30910_cov48-Phaeocystis_antarctica.AAC.2